MQAKEITKWYRVCKLQFPLYVEYWRKQPDVKNRTPVLQEYTFDVEIKLPSGRVVRLRGKFDSVDIITEKKRKALYLQENKSKGDLNVEKLKRQLRFDLQTMMYLVALELCQEQDDVVPHDMIIGGVRYNTIRRPLSGGLHSIRQRMGRKTKKGIVGTESDAGFFSRLQATIEDHLPDFFMRFRSEVTPDERDYFRNVCLYPVLEQLCDWWEVMSKNHPLPKDFCHPVHYQFPYGVWNPMLEGRSSDFDEFMETGSMVGLEKVDTLFRELD
jgi:hypothetical protein